MKLIWTGLALNQLEMIGDYIALDNRSAASRMTKRIYKSTLALQEYPHLGRIGKVEGIRELVIKGTPYIIAYRVEKSCIEILAVLHGAQSWPDQFQ